MGSGGRRLDVLDVPVGRRKATAITKTLANTCQSMRESQEKSGAPEWARFDGCVGDW